MSGRGVRVLLLCTTDAIGGTERVVQTLARELPARGAEVRTLFPATPGIAATLEWFRAGGVRAEPSSAVLTVYQARGPRAIADLARLARTSGADIVNVHYGANHISAKDVLAIRLGGRRCVVSAHHAVPIAEEQKRRMTRLGARLARRVVVGTEAMRGLMVGYGVPAARLEVVPYGISPPIGAAPERAAARRALGLPENALVVASLARLVPKKGLADLIRALGAVRGVGAGAWLVVGGDGPERAALEALARERLAGRVVFAGRLAETGPLYAAADLFALPSHEEGFGLVFVEAAFAGLPSVAAAVGGVPEAVLDGVTGLLVPAGDIGSLVEALERLCDDAGVRARLGAAARERAMARHTEAAMADGYARVLGLI